MGLKFKPHCQPKNEHIATQNTGNPTWSSLDSCSMSHIIYRRIRSLNAQYVNSESREMIMQSSVLVEEHDHYTTVYIKCIS